MFRIPFLLAIGAMIVACTPAETGHVAHDDPCQIGENALAEGNADEAITAFEACLNSADLEPGEEAIIHTRLGGAYLYAQRFEDALQAFNLAYAIAETRGVEFDNSYIRRNRGIARLMTGDADGALSDLEIAARDMSDDISTQLNLGRAYDRLGRQAEAVVAYQNVTRLEPEWAGGWINLSAAFLEMGMNEQAIDQARRAVELTPESGYSLNALCWSLIVDEQFATALPLCEQAVAAEPESGAIIHSLASALEGVGRMDEARDLFADAYALLPDNETLENDYRRTRAGNE